MNKSGFPYRESLLQWIWQELEFNTTSLQTRCGTPVEIIDPGKINSGAGPDFTQAKLRMGNLTVHGDVEIHIHPNHWNHHKHSESCKFNGVILHVVYDGSQDGKRPILRPDGTTPPLLQLKPYLQKPLTDLLDRKKQSGLPCSGNLKFINQSAFEAQIEKAHRHYFEFKTEFLLERYDSSLPLSKAWIKMFTAGLFHTMGIPRNRNEMELLHSVISEKEVSQKVYGFVDVVTSESFDVSSRNTYNWHQSGMRPASFPSKRVPQAAALYHAAHNMSLKTYLKPSLESWPALFQRVPDSFRPGKQIENILKHTIFYPAAYLLGEFLHAQDLKKSAYQSWINSKGGVPREVTLPFQESGFSINKQTNKLGLAHQLKRYCRPVNCHQCKVFKKAINP